MIFLVGMSHKTAPVALREKFAVTDARYDAFNACLDGGVVDPAAELLRAEEAGAIPERVILSTCNRTEVYGWAADPEKAADRVVSAFAEFSGELRPEFENHAYRICGADAVRHLFTVTAGLDSMALGETEILGQVKTAYTRAHAAGFTSRGLNVLFQRALRVGKKVRTETSIGEGRVSIASIAVDLALKIFSSLAQKRVLLIGSGEVARSVCESLMGKGVRELVIVNRNVERAEDLAHRFAARAVPAARLDAEAAEADIVIASAASPLSFIQRHRAEKWIRNRKKGAIFMIDLGMPRNADEDVNDVPGIYLYNLDNLQSIAEQNANARKAAATACRTIVETATDQFIDWLEKKAS